MRTFMIIISILSVFGVLYLIWRKSPRLRRTVKSTPKRAKDLALRVWEYKE